eukprot:TRINITY_DN1154_c0_g2_i1.p1 TRINITY_DN1154_c0_g2~~TRINITY_DN1154_c0_g2_i1.p1  ORF type:complete len:108 (-),score=30.97 TRINITY_DN1154_c0_g2_i1:129-452(-)
MPEPVRLYSKGVFLSFQRQRCNMNHNTGLVKIQGVESKEDVDFYLGKTVIYMYRAKNERNGSKIRTIKGKVTRPHGHNGVVRAQFQRNLPPRALGASVRVMLYPSRV